MARDSRRDPPDSSVRRPDRRNSQEPRRTPSTTVPSERAPSGVPDVQNAQRPKTRRSLEFHRTAHSFPEYGSLKGAIRMPPPKRVYAPKTHLDTLNLRLERSHQSHKSSISRAPVHPSPPKRQKLYSDAREIADFELDTRSRTEHHGSQSSLAYSVSPGVSEYQTVESSTQRGQGRSHRRRRRTQPARSVDGSSHFRRERSLSALDSIENFDELGPALKPAPGHQRTARLISTAGTKAAHAVVGDSADEFILGKPSVTGRDTNGFNQYRKRARHDTADDHDELGEERGRRNALQNGTKSQDEDMTRHGTPSLSRKGDLNPTRWANRQGTHTSVNGAWVQAAVCQPNLRYVAGDGHAPCLLRPTEGAELRAFTEEGAPAEPHYWLKITRQTKALFYHPESNYVKITQPMDEAASTTIGASMVLEMSSKHEASWVADQARNGLGTKIVQEQDSQKLCAVFDQMHHQIVHARMPPPARRPSVIDGPALPPRRFNEPGTQNVAPPSSRTPIRRQMQSSAQMQDSLHLDSEPSRARLPSGSRSLRSRPDAGMFQDVDSHPAPAIHRWSEENPQWSKDWKMPLVFNRTTVDKEDIPRLDEGQCLNDNLIGFGLRYLFDKFHSKHPKLHQRVYLHNSFFYEKLNAGRTYINYDGVKGWTAKVDLLSYDYIVVPVNEHFHWWVAIICNPGKLDPDVGCTSDNSDRVARMAVDKVDGESSDVEMTDARETAAAHLSNKALPEEPELVTSDIVDLVSGSKNASIDLTASASAKANRKPKASVKTYRLEDPRIITLDSLGSGHPSTVTQLKKYLFAEFEHKRNKVITDTPHPFGMKANNIPEQNNLCDCGVYLLGYIQEFVIDPDRFIRTLLQKDSPDWKFDPSQLRRLWRDTIQLEHERYQREQLKAKQQNRDGSAANFTPKGSAEPSRNPSRATSEIAHASKSNPGTRNPSPDGSASAAKTAAACESKTEPMCRGQAATVSERSPPSASARNKSSSRRSPQQPNPTTVMKVASSQEAGAAVLPSIESPEVEELPQETLGNGQRTNNNHGNENPPFLAQLPSSTSPQLGDDNDNDEDHIAEVDAHAFYKSSPARHTTSNRVLKRTTAAAMSSSPAVGGRQGQRRGRPPATAAAHTQDQFVVDGGSPEPVRRRGGSKSSSPVVERAELVRRAEHIDLT